MELSDEIKDALDEKVFVHLGTLMPDGAPHVSVVWIGRDGDKVLFSTAEGRMKPRNLEFDPRVALSFTPPDMPFKNIVLRGHVTKTATDGTWLIDDLAGKYLGHDSYQFGASGEVRVNYEIEIDSASVWG
jgi:PPOX class probable F420-dependent enzyme